MTLVSPSLEGEVQLRHGDKLEVITEAIMEGLFTLRANIPCQWLVEKSVLYWYLPGRAMHRATIPAQECISDLPSIPSPPPVLIYEKQGECLIDSAGNTLWRVAIELARHNGATIYQNIYAVFVSNRSAFAGEDIHRLRQKVLKCPAPSVFEGIDKEHAKQLFEASLDLPEKTTDKMAVSKQEKIDRRDALSPRGTVHMYEVSGRCLIDVAGNTLWRVATELSKTNHRSIYQNVYSIFIANRNAFEGDDISKIKSNALLCPTQEGLDSISKENAKEFFKKSFGR